MAAYLEENPVGTGTVRTVNDTEPDENGNVSINIPADYVKTVNGTAPDKNGNVDITIPDSGGNVAQGADGFSPIATVEQTDTGAVISITDKNGTTTATVTNGKDGADGQPGQAGADGAPGADGANGKDGTSATHSWNGTVLTITSASGTSSADLKGEKGEKGEKGDTGPAGEAGYTPQRGTDYWTDADKAEIQAYVDLTARAGLEKVDNLVRKINVFDSSVIVPYKELNLVGAAVESSGAPGYYYVGKQQVRANNKYVFYIHGRDVYHNRSLFYPNDNAISDVTTDGSLMDIAEENIGGYICITFTVATDGYVAICNYVGSDVVDLAGYEFGLSLYCDYDGTYYSTDVYKNSDVFKVQADADHKPYRGKTAYVLGDSIMAQNRVTNAITYLTGMDITNYAISGSRLSDADGTQENAVCYRCEQMSDAYPDLILIEGGTNDAYYSALGTAGESADVSTVAGAVYVIIQKLEAKYPNVPIVFSTMPYRWLDGQQWKSYATVVEDTCKHYGIPVLNAWTSCGFNEFNQSQYCNDDGIHLNDNGGMRMAKAWLKVIESAL